MIPIELVTTENAYNRAVDKLAKAKILGFDTEGTSLDPHTNRLLLVQICDGITSYIFDMTSLPIKLLNRLKPILESEGIIKIGHNITYDWKIIYHNTRISMECMHDTMIVDRMLYAGLKYKHDLKSVLKRELDIEIEKDTRNTFLEMQTVQNIVWTDEQIKYAGTDAYWPILLYNHQMPKVIEAHLYDKIYPLEMGILAPTASMEYTGVPFNKDMLLEMVKPFQRFVSKAEKALQDLLIEHGAAEQIIISRDGYSALNTASQPQMVEALSKVGVNVVNTQGKPSLNSKDVQRWDMKQQTKKHGKRYIDFDYHDWIEDEEVADALDQYHGLENPFLRAFTFLQGARKLYGTYIEGLLESYNVHTNRVHPGFNSYGAESTGRYSSNGPNFQNLPNDKKLEDLGLGQYSIRKCIEAPKGRKIIIADYSGIELVIIAALSGDKKLMEQIFVGDVHTMVARDVLGFTEITKDNKKKNPYKTMRDGAKTLSYAIAYGTTGRNISETLNIKLASLDYKITAQQGDELINKWYKLFPDTEKYLKSNADHAVLHGYVTDTWGRRRNWDRATFVDKWKMLAAMREGMNMPVQGTSATMTKYAILHMWKRLDRKKARIIITVHDEIVLETVESYAEEAMKIMKECMESAIAATLPSVADVIGKYEGTSVVPAMSDRYDK